MNWNYCQSVVLILKNKKEYQGINWKDTRNKYEKIKRNFHRPISNGGSRY